MTIITAVFLTKDTNTTITITITLTLCSHRLSKIRDATKVLNSFKDNELSTARFNYHLGAAVEEHAKLVLKRHRWDEMSCASIRESWEGFAEVRGEALLKYQTLNEATLLLPKVEDIKLKLSEALLKSSDMAVEETFDELRSILKTIAQLPLQIDFVVSDFIVKDLKPQLSNLSQAFKDSSGTLQYGQLQEAVEGIRVQKAALVEATLIASDGLLLFFDEVVKPKLKAIGKTIEELEPLSEKLKLIRARAGSWDAVLRGLSVGCDLLCQGIKSYDEALPAFQAQRAKRIHGDGAIAAQVEAPAYLSQVMSFSKSVHETAQNAASCAYSRRVPGERPEDFDFVFNFLVKDPMCRTLHQGHCLSKVVEGLQSFANSVFVEKCVLADPDKLAQLPPEQVLPSMMQHDLTSLAKEGLEKCCFEDVNAPVLSKLAHLEAARTVSTIVNRVMCDDIRIPAFQQDCGHPLRKQQVLALLTSHSNIGTLTVVAACVHDQVIKAKELKLKGTDKVASTQLGMTMCLLSVAKQVQEHLKSPSGVLDAEYGPQQEPTKLLQSAYHLTEWAVGIRSFSDIASKAYLQLVANMFTKLAQKLDDELPRWETIVGETTLNVELAETMILQHSFRKEFGPTNELLAEVLREAESASDLLFGTKIGEMKEMAANWQFAKRICESVSHYLLVQAALNAILTNGQSPKGPMLAKKVKAFNAAATTTLKLPSVLAAIIDRLSEGDRDQLPAIPTAAKKAKKDSKEGKAKKAAKKDEEEVVKTKQEIVDDDIMF